MSRVTLLYGVLFSLLIWPVMAQAQSLRFATDPKAPIDIAAGLIDWRGTARQADFTENAIFSQGPLTMQSATMRLSLSANGAAQQLTASGGVVLVSRNAAGVVLRRATADHAVYQPNAEKLSLNGNVEVLESGKRDSVLSGGRLEINMRSGQAELKGSAGPNKGRARIELR